MKREAGTTGPAVELGASKANYLALLVSGLGWNRFEEWLGRSGKAPAHRARDGYDVRTVPVDGLSSTANNARMIREADFNRCTLRGGES